jgi:hypothetical protein
MEVLLGVYVPGIRIPYWDWANGHELPMWVYKPSGVSRGLDTRFRLPTALFLLLQVDLYTQFVSQLGHRIQGTQRAVRYN